MSIRQVEIADPTRSSLIVVDEFDGVLIPNVKFPTAFSLGALEQGKTFKIKYLKERWTWFNDHCFGGDMKMPKEFDITKNFQDIKLFGSWTPSERKIKMHPKLWQLKDESQCLGTLAHEMAHQYVSEKYPEARREDAHGPTWKSVMTRIGLSPSAKWNGRQEDLRSLKEEKVVQRFSTTAPKVKVEKFTSPYNLAVYVNTIKGRETPLVIVGGTMRTPEQHYRTNYVPGFSVKEISGLNFRWYEVANLYIPDQPKIDADFPKELLGKAARDRAEEIYRELEARKRRYNDV